MKILVVDDEALIREVIREYCENEGYEVVEAASGMEALEVIKAGTIDFLILDIMMPKLDGYSTLKALNMERRLPTIMLSARKEEYDKLLGFELGVDDYMTKPFSPKELMARIKAVATRANLIPQDGYRYQDLYIDIIGHYVTLEGQELKLTPKEYELLVYFIQNKNIALSREVLLRKIWGYDFFGDDRTIDTHVKMLRNSLGKYRDCIVTVRGMGYKFVD
ncbi:MAG: response regulator transcription factor [Bacilli bacterium]|nr:response regulator transcription factor [Bacilli bacterium]